MFRARLVNFCSFRTFETATEAMEWIVKQNFEATLEMDGRIVNQYSPITGWRF